MSWLSDAHQEWHHVNGRYAVCPLDCGAGEVPEEEDITDHCIPEFGPHDDHSDCERMLNTMYGYDAERDPVYYEKDEFGEFVGTGYDEPPF